eukprot:TRINITY_DN9806_c0_g1_i3.p2 TRINITY_DN9806_c0_g1~~TRINITY_DN9806_c0_g1_i3.p2  ORF type:complete len:212 (+),score=21.23 TRINITY_DN9806_c0_g1_i3:16-651(+)
MADVVKVALSFQQRPRHVAIINSLLDTSQVASELGIDSAAGPVRIISQGKVLQDGDKVAPNAKLLVVQTRKEALRNHAWTALFDWCYSQLNAWFSWFRALILGHQQLDSVARVTQRRHRAPKGSVHTLELEAGHEFDMPKAGAMPVIAVTWEIKDCGHLLDPSEVELKGPGPHRIAQRVRASGRAGYVTCRLHPNDGSGPEELTFWFDECD